jgi:hypothetical protein
MASPMFVILFEWDRRGMGEVSEVERRLKMSGRRVCDEALVNFI